MWYIYFLIIHNFDFNSETKLAGFCINHPWGLPQHWGLSSRVVELWGKWWTPLVISHPIIQSWGALCPCLQSLLEYSDTLLLLSSHTWDMGFSSETRGSSLDCCSLLGSTCSFLSSRKGEDLSRYRKALTLPPDLLLQAICIFSQLLFSFSFFNVIW